MRVISERCRDVPHLSTHGNDHEVENEIVPMIPRLLTIPQTAELLQVSEKKVRRLIKSGELVAHRVGRQLRISEGDLRQFLEQRRGF